MIYIKRLRGFEDNLKVRVSSWIIQISCCRKPQKYLILSQIKY